VVSVAEVKPTDRIFAPLCSKGVPQVSAGARFYLTRGQRWRLLAGIRRLSGEFFSIWSVASSALTSPRVCVGQVVDTGEQVDLLCGIVVRPRGRDERDIQDWPS
jgi:hypothetical protein